MNINITKFFKEASPMDYSASCAEIGQDAGRYTWRAACDDSGEYFMLDSDEKREAFRQYLETLGAWPGAKIAKWPDHELNALFIQFVSSAIREGSLDTPCPDWAEYYAGAEEGYYSGDLYEVDGEVYFSLDY